MSLKKLLETLAGFGFKQPDAKIYVLLAKKGPYTAKDLALALKIPNWQIYKSVRNLQKKGIITAIRRPALFYALPFEKVIDLAVKARIEEAQQEQSNTHRAMLYWEEMMKENSDSQTHELQAGEEEVNNE